MNILAEKLADLLQIGVEKASELYPLIREQYMVYKATGMVMTVAFFLGLVFLILGGLGYFYFIDNMKYLNSTEEYRREERELAEEGKALTTLSKKMVILSIIVWVISYVIQLILASDIVFIKGMM